MKKLYPLLFLAAWLLAACSNHEKDIVSISGIIKGLGNDTLYIYGTDRLYNRLDTLTVKEDKISTQLEIDTLISAWLRFSDGTEIPIYMNKGEKLKSTDRLLVWTRSISKETPPTRSCHSSAKR